MSKLGAIIGSVVNINHFETIPCEKNISVKFDFWLYECQSTLQFMARFRIIAEF
jgi:hypothetical protein